jgi:hypothetical protein
MPVFVQVEKPLVDEHRRGRQTDSMIGVDPVPTTLGNEVFQRMAFPTVDLNSPWYPAMDTAHKFYLATAGVNIMVLTLFVVLLVNYLVIINSQGDVQSGDKSTFRKTVTGPVFVTCITGIMFAGVTYINRNNSDNLYNTSRSFLVVAAILFTFWSVADETQLTKFSLPSMEMATKDPTTSIFLVFVLFVLTSIVVMYLNGEMRLDVMHPLSNTTFMFVAVVALMAYALTHVFGLLLRTIHSMRINLDINNRIDNAFATDTIEGGLYIGGIALVSMLSLAAIGFLEFNLLAMINLTKPGGLSSVIHIKKSGNNTLRVLAETALVYRHALLLGVVAVAAIMWNRRHSMVTFSEPESSSSIFRQWMNLFVIFLLGPLCSMLVEAAKKISGINSFIYESVFTVFTAGFLLYFGLTYVPWDKNFLIIATGLGFFLFLKYIQSRNNTSNIISSIVLGTIFVFAQLSFKGAMSRDKLTKDSDKAMAWTSAIMVPAFLMLIYSLLPLMKPFMSMKNVRMSEKGKRTVTQNEDAMYDYPSFHVIRIFFVFSLFYTVIQPFVDADGLLTKSDSKDSVEDNVVPGNASASIAVSGILLTSMLMVTGVIFKSLVPVQKQAATSPAAVMMYLILGAGCALLFAHIKQSSVFKKYVQKHQTTQKWQVNLYKDVFAQ